jgi:Putative Actinobacterial Holin-X, holin superfamily III
MALDMDTNARLPDTAPGPVAQPTLGPRPAAIDGPRSTADLVRGIADDASTLVRQQLLLAKQELTEGATVAAKASAVLAAAGVVALFAVGFLLTTLAWGLVDAGLPRWVGFGIVALLLLITAAVLGVIGQRRLAAAKLSPDRAQSEFKQATNELVEGARTGAENVRAEAVATAEAVKVGAVTLPDRARGRAKETAGGAAGSAREAADGVSGAAGRFIRRLRARLGSAGDSGSPRPWQEPGTEGGPDGQDRG